MTINKCNIIQDILPLYAEKMVSKDTEAFVEEHLIGCESCKALFESIQKDTVTDEINNSEGEAKVLKNVKKKMRIRRIVLIASSIILTIAALFLIINTRPVTVDYGVSEKYTQEEMESAVEIIIDRMKKMEGCVLYSVTYRGDEYCESELEYVNTLADEDKGEVFVDCIVFTTDFRSPLFGGGAWNPNRLYHWTWYLARTDGGEWILLTFGMP